MAYTLADLNEAIAAAVPDRDAIVTASRRVTWGELRDRSRRLAHLLAHAGLGCRRVEYEFRRQPADGFDALCGCALALIRDNPGFELSVPEMIFVALAGDIVFVHAVMRQDDFGVLVAAVPQPFDVEGERLAAGFVVVQNLKVLVNELDNPDQEGVGVRA